jgi:nitronate monooxygenase
MPLTANRATDLLGCELPIVLAGMGGVARSELVGAVTAAGGFGFLGMVREPALLIAKEVEALRRMGYGNFGVNIIPAATERALLERQIETIIELHVPAVALFWDIDARVVARLRDAGITVVYQVGSVDEAIAAERAGAQMIIAQGVEAGGHVRGTRPLRELLPATAAAVDVPVLAAGGLATGGDLVTALALGAGGMVLGTALLATHESFAHDAHKQRLIGAASGDTVLTDTFHINWPPGAPVRVLKSDVTAGRRGKSHANERVVIGEEDGRPIYLFSTDSPLRSMTGEFDAMALYAGTGVGRIRKIESAGARLGEIAAEAKRQLAATDGTTIPSSASAVCYAAEMSGVYMGTLEPDEMAAAMQDVAASLLSVLQSELEESAAGRFDAPPFAQETYPLAAWTAKLRMLAGGTRPFGAAAALADLPALARRLGELAPLMPDGEPRETIARLRQVLAERATQQVVRTLQLSLTS